MTNEEVAVKLNDHENEIGSLKHRMDNAEKVINEVHNIATSVQLLAQESKHTGEKVDNLTHKVENLENKPMDDWNKVKVSLISGGLGVILALVINAIVNLI